MADQFLALSRRSMILLIDNYDSFTWNLVHLIGGLGHEVVVHRNDQLTVTEALAIGAEAIAISPGPCTPDQAGICLDLVRACAVERQPLFGVCLGLQSMAQALGGKVIRADKLMHGKLSGVQHTGAGFLSPLPTHFTATRYHSLVADPTTLPAEFKVIATATDDNEIMAIEHSELPMGAVQFHPESIASEHGMALFKGFMEWAVTRQ